MIRVPLASWMSIPGPPLTVAGEVLRPGKRRRPVGEYLDDGVAPADRAPRRLNLAATVSLQHHLGVQDGYQRVQVARLAGGAETPGDRLLAIVVDAEARGLVLTDMPTRAAGELPACGWCPTDDAGDLLEGQRVAQSFASARYARVGGPVKTEDDPLDPTPVPATRETNAAMRYLD